MNANVGGLDSSVRYLAGIALVGATVAGVIGPWGWLGVVPILTGMMRFCPAYSLFGMNTCSKK